MRADLPGTVRSGTAGLARVAAVGDVHVGSDTGHMLRRELEHVVERADVLLLAGDLTQHGSAEEGQVLADGLKHLGLPVAAVLGNHDYHQGAQSTIRALLEAAGVCVLEGEKVVFDIDGQRIGVAGVKGFGGGFPGACGSEFGEEEMKMFMRHSRACAERLGERLEELDCDVKIALTHYAPTAGTLVGERLEIYPFLGSYYLGEVIDKARCALALHGHAHRGTERAETPGGVPVRNVARPVIRLAYKVYCLGQASCEGEPLVVHSAADIPAVRLDPAHGA
jgi:Icc-related predicted phosphoesterase